MFSNQTNVTKQNLHRASLLIVEDNADEQFIISQACKHSLTGIDVIWANNERDALTFLDECSGQDQRLPKLVLLDLYLPRAEQGLSFLSQLKDRSWKRSLPVIVLSQSSRPDDIGRCYDLGANSYITKPLSLPDWFAYFESLRLYWWETVTLPLINPASD